MTWHPEPRHFPAPVPTLAAALVRSTSPVLIAGLLYVGSALGLGVW